MTGFVGSGLSGLRGELSQWATACSFDPLGSLIGSANRYMFCQLKSHRGTDSSVSFFPSG